MRKKLKGWGNRVKRWAKSERFTIKLILLITFIVTLIVASQIIAYQSKHKNDQPRLGVSFSIKYAKELGNDWRANYTALLDDLKVPHFRLMSYWDLVEPKNNEFDFTDLDWQMDQAAARGATVTLAVGQRQPRWPECHIPSWVNESSDQSMRDAELLEYIKTVVYRYKDHPALDSYQLENEAANRHFGDCPLLDNELLNREYSLIKKLDENTKVVINTSNQSGIPIFNGVGDAVGFSVYKHAYFPALGTHIKWDYDYLPAWWHSLRASLVEDIHGTDTFVHELQAEPWGPKPTVQLTKEEQDALMNPSELSRHVNYALSTGMKRMDLWGGEWWYYRLNNYDDQELWNEAKTLYQGLNKQ